MVRSKHVTAILGIGTAVPETLVDQNEAAERLAGTLCDHPLNARFAKRIFRSCGVQTRYTCEPNLLEAPPNCRYLPRAKPGVQPPSTFDRMEVYRRESVPLAIRAAIEALEASATQPTAVTHLITVSCTGQFLPGLDAELVRRLGLPTDVNRIPLTFLGCAAGLKAIGMARRIAAHDRSATVLVVSVELCTLHIQAGDTKEDIFAASFFGDGASACIIGMPEQHHRTVIQLHDDHSELLPDSMDEMTWRVGDRGFDLYLSPNIPKLIGDMVHDHVDKFLQGDLPEYWALHPGGRAIIDAVRDTFSLTEQAMEPSLSILRDYGNMSSATIMFVLLEMQRRLLKTDDLAQDGIAIAFGPGLTLELVRVTFVHRPRVQQPASVTAQGVSAS